MKVEVINISTPLLMSDILDTNTAYLARSLREIQADLICKMTIGEDARLIEDAIRTALLRSDIIFLISSWEGRGGTLLLEAVSKLTERPFVAGTASVAGAVILADEVHQPGMLLEHNGKTLIVLPQYRQELSYLMETAVLPYLQQKIEGSRPVQRAVLRTVGIMESHLKLQLADLADTPDRHITYDSFAGQTTIQLWAKADTTQQAMADLKSLKKAVLLRLGNHVYGEDMDRLEEVLVGALLYSGNYLSAAECHTDGAISALLTHVNDVEKSVHLTTADTLDELTQALQAAPIEPNTDISGWCRQAAEKMLEKDRADVSLLVYNNMVPGGVQVLVTLASPLGVSVTQRTFGGHPEHINHWAATLGLAHLRRWLLAHHA